MKRVSLTRVPGSLAAHAAGFRVELARLGYTPSSVEYQMALMARVSRWLANEELRDVDLDDEQVTRMLAAWREGGRVGARVPTVRSLVSLLGFLRDRGVEIKPVVCEITPLDELLGAYRRHLIDGRGLAPRTIARYELTARRFLEGRLEASDGPTGVEGLTGGEVTEYLLAECRRVSVGSAQGRVAELRSLLRFLHMTGATSTCLAAAVPPIAGWKDTRLVATLSADSVAAILAGCDRSTAIGARDFAVLLVLARLGLRAAEVAGLELDHLDWRAAEIVVRGKGDRTDRLPLSHELGDAIVAYLTEFRPRTECRRLFVTVRAPVRGMHPNTISRIVRCACRRAGTSIVTAHVLRHTLASELLRHGSTLTNIGQVLRHRDLATTAVYAKVDRGALRTIARPWPGAPR